MLMDARHSAARPLHQLNTGERMAKLTLQIEHLEVETFEIAPETPSRGTVHGHGTDAYATCAGHYTCDDTCDQTCGIPASCQLVNSYCGTYDEVGCPASYYNCTVGTNEVYICS
jgi:hypothetical protein